MAFNFNWSPLTADAEFYSRAKDLLTTALNKSPKPPIIVDDILVNELNLGSVPPELEILEIGDLAEDRFRGIFKMCYSGDAFLTLKTRVQANPLNTYLFSKPSFTSPQPLAAASGLTIPLQITLSEIKLSAFIILVFSRQKGLTLVFRNDPLESLKVSSTFDSIPFVREYLQKEIEMQLRTLMMEELPAIIHRLSLRLWCSDYGSKEEEFAQSTERMGQQDVVDPLASPPQDAVDAHGNVLSSSEISALSLDGSSEIHSLFSRKNMLCLAALDDSQRTLSLFTPSIREAVFRAWACPSERSDGSSPSGTPNLIRSHSAHASFATYTFSDNESGQLPSRPSLVNLHSVMTGLSLGAGRHPRTHGRKKKTRVVNLRKPKTTDDLASESGDSASVTEPSIAGGSEPAIPTRIPKEPEEELITPPRSPNRVRFRPREESIDLGETPRNLKPVMQSRAFEPPLRAPVTQATQGSLVKDVEGPSAIVEENISELPQHSEAQQPTLAQSISWNFSNEKSSRTSNFSAPQSSNFQPQYYQTATGGIIEQALLMRIASEIVRRARDEKANQPWESRSEREEAPPPAYGS